MRNDYKKRQTSEYSSYKRLSLEQEKILLDKALNHNDKGAQSQLVISHLYLAIAIARKHNFGHLPMDDLIQEGVLGLWDALKKFDISRKVRFSTFAGHYVRGKILKVVEEASYRSERTISLDVPLSNDSDGNEKRKDMIEDAHHMSGEKELFIQEVEKAVGCDLTTLGRFIEGDLLTPFDRRKIANGIIKSSCDLEIHTKIQEYGISLFSTSDPFERCALFKFLLSLRVEH